MTKRNILAFISSFIFAFTLCAAQTTAPSKPATRRPLAPQAKAQIDKDAGLKPALPTNEQVDEYMKRSFGYDPAVTWQIYSIKESDVPGIAEIIVSVNKGDPCHLFYSSHAQTAFVGQMIPFGPNPFASARARLKGAFGPSRGPATAPIDIVEFSDLECPHCKATQPIVEKLQADFPQVRFVFQQFPLPASLHPWALKAAQYADCAAQLNKENFWKYVDAIFDAQGGIALATADDKLKELATGVGYDGLEIARCAASPATDARVQKSLTLGQSLAVNQTPTVFVNGRVVLGLAGIPYDNLKKLVQFEIDHAGK
ncbi:MAG TPA: thioredoxin domain-containing protein [Candidatus Angelobacter sp.]